jgi:hypothetical protein
MGHQQIMGANDRVFGQFIGAMHGDVFPEDIIVSNAQFCGFVRIFQILGRVANDAACVENISGADLGVTGQINVRSDFALGPDTYMGVNDGIRADVSGGIDLGPGINDSGGMDHI